MLGQAFSSALNVKFDPAVPSGGEFVIMMLLNARPI
jgi:hypothetical protein